MNICARGRNNRQAATAAARRRGRDSLSSSRGDKTSRGEHSDSSARQQRATPAARLTPGDSEKMAADLQPSSHTPQPRTTKKDVDRRTQSGRDGNNSGDEEDGGVSGGAVIFDRDGRVACGNCRRIFSSDRVGVHQEICQRVNPNDPVDDARRGRKIVKMRTTSPPIRSTRRSSCPAVRKESIRSRRERDILLGHNSGDRFRHPALFQAADTMVCG